MERSPETLLYRLNISSPFVPGHRRASARVTSRFSFVKCGAIDEFGPVAQTKDGGRFRQVA
jgi:hypothetical protein